MATQSMLAPLIPAVVVVAVMARIVFCPLDPVASSIQGTSQQAPFVARVATVFAKFPFHLGNPLLVGSQPAVLFAR